MKTGLVGKLTGDARNWRAAAALLCALTALHCGDSELPAQLSLSPSNPQIAQGTAQKFSVHGVYSTGHQRDVTSSVHLAVFAADGTQTPMGKDGLLQLDKPGSYQVLAVWQGRTVATTIHVTAAKLKSVAISPTMPRVARGLTQNFTALASFSDGTTQDVTEGATWSEKDLVGTKVALIGSNGIATAQSEGQASISVHYKTVSASTTLTVTAPVATALLINPTNPTLVVGGALTFSAQATFSDGTAQDVTAAADWGAADLVGTGVAAMSGSTATADSAGQATISVYYAGLEADTTLTVNAVTLTALAISPLNPTVNKGATKQFSASGTYNDGTKRDLTTTVSWTATDIAPAKSVASITAHGLATANTAGKATIAASYLGLSAATVLTVPSVSTLAFGPMTTLAAGAYSFFVDVTDLNADGKLDFVVSNTMESDLSVYLGNGGGTWAPQALTTVGSEPTVAVPIDLNMDGKLDLVVANQGSNSISVLLGKGDGTFAAPVSYAVGSLPRGVVVRDFNNDERLDVAVSNYSGTTLNLFLGKGDGTLTAASVINLGVPARSLGSGDLNGDGQPDLVVGSDAPKSVLVLLGRGDGTFASAVSYAGGGGFEIHVQDLNQDGKLDVITADYMAGTVSLLYGKGDGTLAAPVSYRAGSNTVSVAVADVDGDGLNDLAAANWNIPGTVTFLLGKADGSFGTGPVIPVGSTPGQVVLRDLNGDGLLDLVVANAGSRNLGILLNTSM